MFALIVLVLWISGAVFCQDFIPQKCYICNIQIHCMHLQARVFRYLDTLWQLHKPSHEWCLLLKKWWFCMRKHITHQNLDLITRETQELWKAIFSNLTCFCCKNANSHKSTFNSRVCFIERSEDRNNLSFAKTQLLTLSYNGPKILMSGIVLLIFFFILKLKKLQHQSGKKFTSSIIQ